jgi:penicillin-binding protein 1B
MLPAAPPVPPLVRAGIVAGESPVFLERPHCTPAAALRLLRASQADIRMCGGGTIAWAMMRSVSPRLSPPKRMWRWHLEGMVATCVVGNTFTPDELLRGYAADLNMGKRDGRELHGFEDASRFYYRTDAAALKPGEVATLAQMIRAPNFFSPLRDPRRAHERRDRVLEAMRRANAIDERQYRAALAEPLTPSSAAPNPL